MADLKKHLQERGLSDAGLKAALVARLKEALAGGGGGDAGSAPAPSPAKKKAEPAEEPSPKKQRKGSKGGSDAAEVRARTVRMLRPRVPLRSATLHGQKCAHASAHARARMHA